MHIKINCSLQYIVAVLMEVQRIGNIAPVSVGHRAMKTSELRGHIIPKVRRVRAIRNKPILKLAFCAF